MEKYSLTLEVNDHFLPNHLEDGRLIISILVPEKFRWLWIAKLNKLHTTDVEIEYYRYGENHPCSADIRNSENMEQYKMIGETTDHYYTTFLDDGRLEISILIPERFIGLWINKLNDLYTTDEEIEYYQSENDKRE